LMSVTCRLFTHLPKSLILGNSVSDKRASRKFADAKEHVTGILSMPSVGLGTDSEEGG
jgi:hypothetical protein